MLDSLHLFNCRVNIYRATQDIVVKAFSGGLAVPKAYLEDLKAFWDCEGSSRRFRYWQIYRFRWLKFVNIETLTKMIDKADSSIQNLVLINPQTAHTRPPEDAGKVYKLV